ncbi:MAG: phytanoyl-CoA dioxygenase family protein [Pseudomonadales bacterium]
MTFQKLPNTSSPQEITAVLREDGVACIKDFAGAETLAGLKQDLMPLLEGTRGGEDEFLGAQTRRVSRLFARTRHIASIAANPLYLETARAILQADPVKIWVDQESMEVAPDFQVSITQAIQIRPGQGKQPLHRDDAVFLWRHPTYGREARLQIMVAISDFTQENGGTRVIPGSHKWDDERAPQPEEAISAEMDAGDALVWVGSLYHGGGENRSNRPRTGVTMAYDLSFLRQEENQYLSIPIEKMKAFPEEIQRLLGWSRGATFGGFVEIDGQLTEPLELLKRDDFTKVGFLP